MCTENDRRRQCLSWTPASRCPGGDRLEFTNSGGQQYNPDLLVIEVNGTHWIVEVKSR
jgi:hypothetical protein